MNTKTAKQLFKLAINLILIGLAFWFIETLYFLIIHGWHWVAINKYEERCDSVVSFLWSTSAVMIVISFMHSVIESKEIDNQLANRKVFIKFKDAPVGARFKYPNKDQIYVKINSYPKGITNDGRGLICSWNGNVTGYQEFFCFSDDDKYTFETEIELV